MQSASGIVSAGLQEAPVPTDGHGKSDIGLLACRDDVVGIETTVGAHGELSSGSGVAQSAHRLRQEVGCIASGVSPSPSYATATSG